MTINDIIEIAEVSQYLAARDIRKGGLLGDGIDLQLPRKLYCIRKNVEWLYNLSPSNSTLTATSNYLYSLCRNGGEAQYILNISSGGSVSPVAPTKKPDPYDFIASASTSASAPLKSGDTSVTLSRFIGFNIEFYRGGVVQYTTNPGDGSNYYSWDSTTGLFTCFASIQLGEQLRIAAVI